MTSEELDVRMRDVDRALRELKQLQAQYRAESAARWKRIDEAKKQREASERSKEAAP